MAEDNDNKTEQPTSKRLTEARKEGDVLQSQEIKSASGLLAILIMVWLVVPGMMGKMKIVLGGLLGRIGSMHADSVDDLQRLSLELVADLGLLLAVPFALFIIAAVATQLIQVGWLITPKRITPDLNKLNPLAGVKRLFSVNSLVELGKNIAKMTLVAVICVIILRPHLREMELLTRISLDNSLIYLHKILVRLIFGVLLTVLVLAGIDWFWQRHSYTKKHMMTKQEVKDEQRQSDGDPMVKSRIRSLRMQRARQRMMAAIPKADVVITNPTHFACALKYDQESMKAPVLVAKGQDLVALRIRQIAEENKVPVVENPPLARALYASVELDREIPPDHYKAVAEVISYVFRLRKTDRRYRT